ncbi:MAG: DUF342 domain-containing protein [Planctomycetes bacterium]|nr:DUF342 domain-containing protein [Planctomycetota bacterium]
MNATGQIKVIVAADGEQATLVAPAGLKSPQVTPEALRLVAEKAGVTINQKIERSLAAFADGYGTGDSEHTAVIATSSPAVQGQDGRLEWNKGFDPTASDESGSVDHSESIDHYAGRSYVRVKAGDVIGVVHQPTAGTDGCDVRGRDIKPRPGRPLSIKFHPTVSVDPEGQIIAQSDGVLTLAEDELSVSQSLDVPGNVDFSTGHIDFGGSVTIAGGIRPGFEVKAKDDVSVAKLIEGAEIQCGGDLIARSGMTGQDRGTITVGRNAKFPYLNNVKGVVKGDLVVEREIVDCRLVIGNDLKCPNGAVLGGEVVVAGSFVVKVLGSEGWTPTTIKLGDVPLLRSPRRKVVEEAEEIKGKIAKLAETKCTISMNPRPSHSDKEKLTEISFETSEFESELAACTARLDEIDAAIQSRRKLDVHIAKTIYPKVTLTIGDMTVTFKDAVTGPLWICWDAQRQLVYRTGSSNPRPLADIAHVFQAPAARPGGRSASKAVA